MAHENPFNCCHLSCSNPSSLQTLLKKKHRFSSHFPSLSWAHLNNNKLSATITYAKEQGEDEEKRYADRVNIEIPSSQSSVGLVLVGAPLLATNKPSHRRRWNKYAFPEELSNVCLYWCHHLNKYCFVKECKTPLMSHTKNGADE
jgi:hypothetical protein